MPFKGDSDYAKSKFVQLKTCIKCPNHGIFEKSELDSLIKNGFTKCPFCKNEFDMRSKKMKPPYGKMQIFKYNNFFSIIFNMSGGKEEGKTYYSRTQYVYVPISKEGKLGLWLLIQAWKNGKLFKLGTSITTRQFGIVFAGIHMKTQMSGGLINHGYGINPSKDMKQSVLPNLISECNASGIFTPEQLVDFEN